MTHKKLFICLILAIAVVMLAVSCVTFFGTPDYDFSWLNDTTERQKSLSGLQDEDEVNSVLTEAGEKSWHIWAENLLNLDYIQKQIEVACEKADSDVYDTALAWADIAGLDGFYRDQVQAEYGDAGVELYDLLDEICFLFLLDPEAAKYNVFENHVQAAVNNENASATAPSTEESNPYFSDNRCRLMPVPVVGIEPDQLEDIYNVFKDAHPQYYFIGTHGSLTDDEGKTYGLDLYVYDIFEKGSRFEEVVAAVAKAQQEYRTADWENLEEVAKFRHIYDWLAKHVDYDYFAAGYISEAELKAAYPDSYKKYLSKADAEKEWGEDEKPSADGDHSHSQTIWSVFIRNVEDDYPIYSPNGNPIPAKERPTKFYTVCAGYSAAYSLLCGSEDLDAIEMSGSGHAWNRAKIDGEWYNMDCTWDDVGYIPDGPGLAVQYQYFARSDKFFYDSHEVSDYGISNRIRVTLVGEKDFKPYEHYYYKTDKGWIHGYKNEDGIVFLEQDGKPVLDKNGKFVTFDGSNLSDIELIPFDDMPGYEKHDDSVYHK